jgi:hypothetical protein
MDVQPSNPASTRSPKKPIAKPVQKVSTAVNIEVSPTPRKCNSKFRSADDSPLHAIPKKTAVQKIQVVVQKMQANHSDFECKLSFGFECTSPTGDQRAPEYSLGRASNRKEYEKVRSMPWKTGIGCPFRNIWNGTWWVHVRFCSVRCEAIYQDTQNNAATHRWHAFLADGTSRS